MNRWKHISIFKCTIKNVVTLMEHTFYFIADTFDTDRSRPFKSCNDDVHQANQGPIPK